MMWWKWTLGMAGIYASVIVVACLMGDPWPNGSDLPRIIVGALLLAAIGAVMWRGERASRTSQEDYELYQRGKWFGGRQAMTRKERFLAWVDGLE